MDISKCVTELVEHYGTEAAVAELAGCNQSTINRMKNSERMPSLLLGLRILELHEKIKPKRKRG